jgi:hypothetical protein
MRPRKNPTRLQAQAMQWSTFDLDYVTSMADEVRTYVEQAAHDGELPPVPVPYEQLRVLCDEVMPTFALIKLGALLEEALDTLLFRRFPELKATRLSVDRKIKTLEKLHVIDSAAINKLWEIRNLCVHNFKQRASWDDYKAHFANVEKFVHQFDSDPRPRKKKR